MRSFKENKNYYTKLDYNQKIRKNEWNNLEAKIIYAKNKEAK